MATSDMRAPQLIRIGVLLPLTGDLAVKGTECLDAMELAVDEVNASGGIHALGGARLELVKADSGGKADGVEDELEHLTSGQGVLAVLGGYQSAVAIPAGEVAEKLKLPFIVTYGAANEITERDLGYLFRLSPKAEWFARDQVQFLANDGLIDGPVTKVALLHEDGAFGRETAAEQRKYLSAAGMEVVCEIAYAPDQADLNEALLQVKSSGAQAVLAAAYLDDALLVVDSAAKLHLSIPILDAGSGAAEPDFLSRVGDTGVRIFTEFEYVPGKAGGRFDEDYVDTHGSPASAAALYSYQAVWLLANALERADSTDGKRLRAALATTAMTAADHMVLPQSLLTFDGDGQNRGAHLFVAELQNRRWVPLWPSQSTESPAAFP
ncbi:MAG: ABC transporter substrate-binding protein [Actinobacteria bacterium]|nr:ABC transporter substrate-binding protein [Actinomycetota bacterium]